MKKRGWLVAGVAIVLIVALAGCSNLFGRDSGGGGGGGGSGDEGAEVPAGAAQVVTSQAALPDPSEDNEGFLFFVQDEFTFYYSTGVEFVAIDLSGPPGVSINWLGALDDFPESPSAYDAFYNTSDRRAYLYDGSEWLLLIESGATWITGAGAPQASLGADGDLYLDTGTGNLYRKEDGSWGSPIANITGEDGPTWLVGAGPPSGGENGDLYLDTTTGNVYIRQSGSWGSPVTNLTGPAGATGAAGATWRVGSGEPSSALGSNGDLYLDSATGNVYRKSSGTWLYLLNILGLAQYNVHFEVVANVNQPGVTQVAGVEVSLNGAHVGTTDEDGRFTYSTGSGSSVTLDFEKKFFVSGSETIDPDVDTGDTIVVELPPQIFIPDTGNSQIVRIDDMAGTNRVESDVQIGVFSLEYPTWLTVDYERGYIYVADGNEAEEISPQRLLRLSDFPPGPEDVTFLTNTAPQLQPVTVWEQNWEADGAAWVVTQIALTDSGILAVDPNEFSESEGPKMLFFDESNRAFGGLYYQLDGEDNGGLRGVAVLQDDRIIYVEAGPRSFTGQTPRTPMARIGIADDISDIGSAAQTPFVPGTLDLYGTDGTGANEVLFPTTIHVSRDDQYVYISDTGTTQPEYEVNANHRVARYDIDGTNRANYGVPEDFDGSQETGEFYHPIVLGVLPDNRVYVMNHDAGGDFTRAGLARFAWVETGVSEWQLYSPSGSGELAFIYQDYGYYAVS